MLNFLYPYLQLNGGFCLLQLKKKRGGKGEKKYDDKYMVLKRIL